MNKAQDLIVLALLTVGMIACGSKSDSASASSKIGAKKEASASNGGSSAKSSSSNRKGKLVYKQYCVICHGGDGTLAVSNATDLSTSTISLEDRIDQITNGKGLMTPYKDILSKEQISAVAEYIEELRK